MTLPRMWFSQRLTPAEISSWQVQVAPPSMSVKDVDSLGDDAHRSHDRKSAGGHHGGQEVQVKTESESKHEHVSNGLSPIVTHGNNIPVRSSSQLPLCLAAKDLPHPLPVYCGACTHNGVIISQDALQSSVITSCPLPLTMPPMTLTDPSIIPSVMSSPALPMQSLADHSMKLQLSPPATRDLNIGFERECRWLQCNRRFTNLDDLVNHVNDHHVKVERPEIDYQCKWTGCPRQGKGFNARYKMLIHIRTHTNEKPHRCGLCGKCFSRLENLKIHNRSHTGEKPYICPFEGCNKAYSNSSDRFKHVRTHQEEKPYICKMPGCNKRYTDPSSLRKHVRTIGHHYQGDGAVSPKSKRRSPPLPQTSSPNILTITPSSNGILGNLPTPHFMPLTSNIFPVSALQSPFPSPVMNSIHINSEFIPTSSRGGVFVQEMPRSLNLSVSSSSTNQNVSTDSPSCQEGPLDLSRSPAPHNVKEEDMMDATEHVQVD